jgi:VanZ family protein
MEIRLGKLKYRIEHPLRYVAIALCIALFVVLNMIIIFKFSAESREESGDRSASLTNFVLHVIYPHYDEMSYTEQTEAAEKMHHIVRKAAHFLEYALLGFLTSSLMLFLRRYLVKRKIELWKTWFYPAEFCFLYAITDEIHQVYSERGPSPKDVLIDTAGALFGILLIQLIVYFVGVFLKRRRLKSSVNGEAEAAIVSDSLPTAEEDQAHALCAMPPEEDSRVPDEGSPRGATAEEDPSDNREEEVAPCELPPTD